MKRASALTLGLFLIGFAGVLSPHGVSGQTGGGWTTLFNGSSLSG